MQWHALTLVSDERPVVPDFAGNRAVLIDEDGGTPDDVMDVLEAVPAEPARRAITSVLIDAAEGCKIFCNKLIAKNNQLHFKSYPVNYQAQSILSMMSKSCTSTNQNVN